jgi:hypothetical protein
LDRFKNTQHFMPAVFQTRAKDLSRWAVIGALVSSLMILIELV